MQEQYHLRLAFLRVLRDVESRKMKEICLSMLGQGLAYSNISKKRQPDMSQDFIEYLDGEDRLDELKKHLNDGYPDIMRKVRNILSSNIKTDKSSDSGAFVVPENQDILLVRNSRQLQSIYKYKFAISFAGEDRKYAQELFKLLEEKGLKTFYDFNEQGKILGEDFYQKSQSIYRDSAQFCIVLISTSYVKKLWTSLELKYAQERALKQENYIIPVRIDDTEVPGIRETTGFIDLRKNSLERVADLLEEKLIPETGE